MAAGPGPLEVISAADAVHVQDLSRKIKSGDQAGFQGLFRDLGEIHSAHADLGLVIGIGSRYGHGKLLNKRGKP